MATATRHLRVRLQKPDNFLQVSRFEMKCESGYFPLGVPIFPHIIL